MKTFFRFLVSRAFLINLVLAGLFVWLAKVATFAYLDSYTDHGETISVPDLSGFSIQELDAEIADKKLRYVIVDSIYDDNSEKGTVIEQNPSPNSLVKENRTIYLTVNAMLPKMISMPNLKNLSRRQAVNILEVLGLKVENLQPKNDICVDCVLDQLYKGKSITPGTMIPKGSKITIVIGSGQSDERVPIPKLAGLTIEQAKQRLNEMSLNLGSIVQCEGCTTKEDSAAATVYRQNPTWYGNAVISLGSEINVWLSTKQTSDSTAVNDTIRNDAPQ